MADVKISQLPAATTPLTGTELVPLVQSGVTKRVAGTDLMSSPIAGNLNFTGTGNRITGDFSNATLANRVMFQTSTTNGGTNISLIPNGTVGAGAGSANLRLEDNTSISTGNGSFGSVLMVQDTDFRIQSSRTGTGTFLPMTFYTGGSERARIDSSGNLLVGATSAISNIRLRVSGGGIQVDQPTSIASGSNTIADNGSSPNTLRLYNGTDSNNTTNRFLICDAAASVLRAEIRSNGGLANYQANNVNLSDRREKTNFAPAKSYLETICAIPVQTFNYIDQNMEEDPGLTLGVVAQDVQAVAPELVMEGNWGTQDEPKMRLSIYQTDLQYALMKALQELKAEFDAYKATHP